MGCHMLAQSMIGIPFLRFPDSRQLLSNLSVGTSSLIKATLIRQKTAGKFMQTSCAHVPHLRIQRVIAAAEGGFV